MFSAVRTYSFKFIIRKTRQFQLLRRFPPRRCCPFFQTPELRTSRRDTRNSARPSSNAISKVARFRRTSLLRPFRLLLLPSALLWSRSIPCRGNCRWSSVRWAGNFWELRVSQGQLGVWLLWEQMELFTRYDSRKI